MHTLGLYALLASRAIPNLRTIAIEPHPDTYRILEFNVISNPEFTIKTLKCAVSDKSGIAKMKTSGGGHKGLDVAAHLDPEGNVEVNVKTLEEIVADANLERVDAIKIDVEGYEDRVLIPYLDRMPDELCPGVIVLEHNLGERWIDNPIEAAISKGYVETARTIQDCVLVRK